MLDAKRFSLAAINAIIQLRSAHICKHAATNRWYVEIQSYFCSNTTSQQ
jgi:hypothetical protein